MNKKELIRAISQELAPPMSQDKITLILDKAVEITKRTLADDEPVKWAGFGSFVLKNNDSCDFKRNNMLYRYTVHRKRLSCRDERCSGLHDRRRSRRSGCWTALTPRLSSGAATD